MEEDKRVRRTKKLLRQALAELMREKEFKNITVTDVVRRADINRGTFYTYYRDVFELREKVENELVDTLRGLIERSLRSPDGPDMYRVLDQAAAYLEDNRELTYALLSDRSMGSFEDKLMRLIEECGRRLHPPQREEDHFAVWFAAAGCIGVLKKWLTQDKPAAREAVIRRVDELLRGSLYAF